MDECLSNADPLQRKIFEIVSTTKEEVSEINGKLSSTVIRTEALEREVLLLNNNMMSMQKELKFLRKKARINNLILQGLEDSQTINNNLLDTVLSTIQKINSNIRHDHIVSTRRLGRSPGKRPVLVEFVSQTWKASLFKNMNILKSMNMAISNDLLPEELEEKKKLLLLRPKLHELGIAFKLHDEYIIIDGKKFNSTTIQEKISNTPALPSDIVSSLSMPARPFKAARSDSRAHKLTKSGAAGLSQGTGERTHDLFRDDTSSALSPTKKTKTTTPSSSTLFT